MAGRLRLGPLGTWRAAEMVPNGHPFSSLDVHDACAESSTAPTRQRDKAALLKRIATIDLRVGMYVDEICGSWMDHPFWRTRFLIKTERELRQIQGSGVTEVWIDPAKGLDAESHRIVAAGREEVEAQVERQLETVAAHADGAAASTAPMARGVGKASTSGTASTISRPGGVPAARGEETAIELRDELERASRIFRESRRLVDGMFDEARMGSVRSTDAAEAVAGQIADSVLRHPSAMIGLARVKRADDYTFMHSVAVAALMVALARTLGLDEEQARHAGLAGLLHDVGKAQIPLAVLNKPGTLTEDEWSTMRSHPERGWAILRATQGVTPEALDAVLHHHEKIDGSGYPHHLKGDEISVLAKMAAVCDVYDAITSNRPYKAGWQPTVAIRKMTEWIGHFDNSIFKGFVRTVGIYPLGSLVRLKSQRLAVVVEHDPAQLLAPTVKAFFSLRSKVYIEPTVVRLDANGQGDKIVGYEDPATHGIKSLEELWVPIGAMQR
jgi:putative nucleotidyltransferase with HDIG domain